MFFEEGSAESQQLHEEDGVRVQGGTEAGENLEDVRREVGEMSTRSAEVGRERDRRRFGGFRGIAGSG